MGKETELPNEGPDGGINPDDPLYWDEATVRKFVAHWLFLREGQYRGNPSSRDMLLTEEQKATVSDTIIKYWMPKDIDTVIVLAEEDDNAQETPREDKYKFATIIGNIYERITEEKSERIALNTVKDRVADRLSVRDLKGLPAIAAVHARQMVSKLAAWEKPRPKPPNPYSPYL